MRSHSLPALFALLFPFLCSSPAQGQTFNVGDSTATVTNTVINAGGLSAGDSISFQGNIQVAGGGVNAVVINPIPADITLSFETGSSTIATGGGGDAVSIQGAFDGTFNNMGTITSLLDDGIDFGGPFTGTFVNTGTISGGDVGVNFDVNMNGTFTNQATITGMNDGVDVDGSVKGTFINRASIIGLTDDGVEIDNNLSGTFNNFGLIDGRGDDGVDLKGNLKGVFNNSGIIRADDFGIYIGKNIRASGTLTNSGTISGETDGIYIDNNLAGALSNSGSISGGFDGVHIAFKLKGSLTNTGSIVGSDFGIIIDDEFEGTIFNSGVIEGSNKAGIWMNTGTGTLRNHGGRIQGGNNAIRLKKKSGTVVLSGPSHIVGKINGGAGNGDVLRFENMRGISDAKKAELAALAIADSPALTTITLFGEQLSWAKFEDIQANLATLQSYSSLINGSGLASYAAALDNVQGLNDSFRDFLRALNDADGALLNEIAKNASGQNLIIGLDDFVTQQDQRIFSLFSDQFSSLRGGVSGRNQLAGTERTGLFTREVQAGAAVNIPDDTAHTFVTGYFGNGNQAATSSRSASSFDNTSILFGQGRNISDQLYLGLFGGYVKNESDSDRFGSLLKNEVGYVGLNAQIESGFWFANVVAAYGYHDQKSIRRDFQGNRMQGDTDGHQGLLYTQVGRDFFVGESKQARVTPYLGFALSSLSMDGFTENGPAATSLRIADQNITSTQSVLGVSFSGHKEVSSGWVKPKIDAAWWHGFDGTTSSSVSLATPGLLNNFGVIAPSANQDRAVFQLGLEAGFDNIENWTFQVNYFGSTGSGGYSEHGGSLSAKVEF